MTFSISTGVGFIALFGVAVLNGVVMVSYINRLRDQGRTLEQAVNEGTETRLRPRPDDGARGSLIWGSSPWQSPRPPALRSKRPLATVVIGGLITSTLLTLLILPTLYGWFECEGVELEPILDRKAQPDLREDGE